MTEARIISTGSFLPGKPVRNSDIEPELKKYYDEGKSGPFLNWVRDLSGVQKRYWAVNESVEDMCLKAAEPTIRQANLEPRDIDFVLASSFTPDYDISNLGLSIAGKLGIKYGDGVGAFVFNTACTAFVYGLDIAHSYIKAGKAENVLVVAAEKLSKLLDPRDPKTFILFGDGACAAVVQKSDEVEIHPAAFEIDYSNIIELKNADMARELILSESGYEFVDVSKLLRESVDSDKGVAYVEKQYLKMEGKETFKRAVRGMIDITRKGLEKSGYNLEKDAERILIIPHQANQRITKEVDEFFMKRGLPPGHVVDIISETANVSGATSGISLDMVLRGKTPWHISENSIVVMPSAGGGMSYAGNVLENLPMYGD